MLSDAEIELLTKQETSLEDHQAIMKIDGQKLLNRLKNQSGKIVIATKEDEKTLKHYAKLSRRQAIILGLTNINHYYHRQKYHCKNISQAYHLSEIVLDQEAIYQLWEIHEKSGRIPLYPWENQETVNELAYFKLVESAVQVKSCLYTILEDLQYELFLNQPSPILDRLASFVALQQDPQPILANIERLKHVLSRCQDIAELSVFLLRDDLDHEFKKCQAAHYEESNPAIRTYLKNVCTLLGDLRQDPTLRRAKPIDIFDQPKYRQHFNNWHSYAQQQGKPLLTTLLYLYLFLQAKDPQDRVRVRQRQHKVMGNFFRALLTQQELCHYYRRQTRSSRNATTHRSTCVINGERHDWDAKTHSYRQRHYP